MVGEGCGLEVQVPIGVLAGEPPVGGVVGAVEFAVVSGGGLEGGIPRGGVISGPAGEFPLKGFSGAIGLSGPGCLIEVDDFIDDIPGDGVAGEFSGLGFFEGGKASPTALPSRCEFLCRLVPPGACGIAGLSPVRAGLVDGRRRGRRPPARSSGLSDVEPDGGPDRTDEVLTTGAMRAKHLIGDEDQEQWRDLQEVRASRVG